MRICTSRRALCRDGSRVALEFDLRKNRVRFFSIGLVVGLALGGEPSSLIGATAWGATRALQNPEPAAPARSVRRKKPALAATLSIIPGLGQAYNGDLLEGTAWLAAVIGASISRNPYVAQVGFDLWMYNLYDAYRDAGAPDFVDTAPQNVFQNYFATFNPLNIWDPVGAPILGFQGFLVTRPGRSGGATLGPHEPVLTPLAMGFVGLGEEGLFRGLAYPGFSHLFFGSKWAGAIASSATFSAVHAIDGTSYSRSAPVLGYRFVLGMLFCWMAERNHYDLRKGIFAHSWFDVLYDWDQLGIFSRVNLPPALGGVSPVVPPSGAPGWIPKTFGLRVNLPF